jgi:GNAT superfamily N-acetyltransferase
MEIRTIKGGERLDVATMLDAWPLAEGWSAGDRFRKIVEHDPGFADENVFVAIEKDRLLASVVLLPRHLQILGHSVPSGGLGSLYTDPDARGRGIATELLESACDAMRARGLELGVLFPGAPPAGREFFEKRGWFSWGGQQTILRREPDAPVRADREKDENIDVRPIDPDDARALQSVKSIHTAYGASRSGTVVRDDALWKACLQLTPAPREEFRIARRGGLTVAYARAAIVDDVLTITEFGRFEDGAGALAKLIGTLLEPREDDPLARGKLASAELRSFVVLPTFDDIGLTVALEEMGIRSHPMEDACASLRCVNLIGFASRLDVDLLDEEDGAGFLRRILPPDAMVFWPADRF